MSGADRTSRVNARQTANCRGFRRTAFSLLVSPGVYWQTLIKNETRLDLRSVGRRSGGAGRLFNTPRGKFLVCRGRMPERVYGAAVGDRSTHPHPPRRFSFLDPADVGFPW